jgi:hypothetical protein
MHELSRMAYLEAMGVDSYVSRQQLPGAALTSRLVILRNPGSRASVAALPSQSEPTQGEVARNIPTIDLPAATPGKSVVESAPVKPNNSIETIRLSLCAITAGNCLWLESLGESPLASQQVLLIRSMAHALAIAKGLGSTFNRNERPDIAYFNWPMHNNTQLDNSVDAAKSGLAAFLARRLEAESYQNLVILGESCAQWVAGTTLAKPMVATASTVQMLENPGLKIKVWQDLKPLYSAL